MCRHVLFAAFCLVAGLVRPVLALDQVDVRFLVDVSAPMHESDVHGLRGSVLEQAVQQLPRGTRAGLWNYSRVTSRMANHGPATELWRQVATIYARNLTPGSQTSDLDAALENVVGSLSQVDRRMTHVLLLSNGRLNETAPGAPQERVARLIQKWGKRLAANRVRLHAVSIGTPGEGDNPELLRQLAASSNGLYRQIAEPEEVTGYVLDWIRLLQLLSEAIIDDQGRFQVPPGAERFTVFWPEGLRSDSNTALVRPDGQVLNRTSALEAGRWQLGEDYEIATLERPAPGWWQVQGTSAQRVVLVSDLHIRVDGVVSPVIPSAETSALVTLYSDGQRLERADFLDMLDVRAWLVQGSRRWPLPVERRAGSFEAFFVNLDDGAYDLEVQVVGPTFAQQVLVPFHAQNPLRVEIRQAPGESAVAWLSFNHAEVNYAGVRAAARVRKPPGSGVLVPAEKMPNGIWRLPLNAAEGLYEVAFSVSGNYLNGEGFYVKTGALALRFPLPEGTVERARFDAQGERLADMAMQTLIDVNEPVDPQTLLPEMTSSERSPGPGNLSASLQAGVAESPPTAEPVKPAPLIPLWFAALIATLNLLIGGLIWWIFRLEPLPEGAELQIREVEA